MINELSVGAFPDVLYEDYQYGRYLTLLQVRIYSVRIITLMKPASAESALSETSAISKSEELGESISVQWHIPYSKTVSLRSIARCVPYLIAIHS